ncbi:hypothetical protein PTSG_01190 [Salpingoeca rosetta]|uniref:WW domain-containing protein n=1 Tax=Salpingoeca rosetta (strain ATCC 50818 / BSB-021) TaxID=946362 RepID=F2U127_SALR5|nr:uncharacterized protein PTSG_01190 [Salpingoeca rosetta]EGD80601.1 hypothetical protein PTSG_01190 [Salpingoeca rosetta]|eukprot:XP_004997162.1 hypothetical protein PTSG_01190 [Salpingoeca rosetta]
MCVGTNGELLEEQSSQVLRVLQLLSIEFHESGKRHKENVAQRLKESRQNFVKRQKDESSLKKMLDQAKQDALKSLGQSMHSNPNLLKDTSLASISAKDRAAFMAASEASKPQPEQQQQQQQQQWKSTLSRLDADESMAKASTSATAATTTAATTTTTATATTATTTTASTLQYGQFYQDPNGWMKCDAGNGMYYYYNVNTKVSTWARPAEFVEAASGASKGGSDASKGGNGTEGAAAVDEKEKKKEGDEAGLGDGTKEGVEDAKKESGGDEDQKAAETAAPANPHGWVTVETKKPTAAAEKAEGDDGTEKSRKKSKNKNKKKRDGSVY